MKGYAIFLLRTAFFTVHSIILCAILMPVTSFNLSLMPVGKHVLWFFFAFPRSHYIHSIRFLLKNDSYTAAESACFCHNASQLLEETCSRLC